MRIDHAWSQNQAQYPEVQPALQLHYRHFLFFSLLFHQNQYVSLLHAQHNMWVLFGRNFQHAGRQLGHSNSGQQKKVRKLFINFIDDGQQSGDRGERGGDWSPAKPKHNNSSQ